MCGINGIFNLNGTIIPDAEKLLQQMNDSIAHRGPDDHGKWVSRGKQVAFGHRRLSIIDLSPSGHQPMVDESGNAIVFNGEIYNYKEIKSQTGPSIRFHTDSDTEVLLQLYTKKQHETLKDLNGMFAFAYWEESKETLYLARDRAGKKPLYYCEFKGIFSFSSEIKALLTLPWVKAIPDEESIYHFLTFNQLPPTLTMFKGIHKLAPGHRMTINKGRFDIEQYWEISPEDWTSKSEKEIGDAIYRTLEKSVAYRMVADVPVGAFLSGGVDSSALVAMMSTINSTPVKTYSVGFKDQPDYDEKSYAHRIAGMFKTEHHEVNIDAGDIANSLPLIIDSFDEPMADATCIPIYFLSKLAREKGTIVVQTGDGADELFAGYRAWLNYNRYYPLYHFYSKTPAFLRQGIAGIINETKGEASALRELFSRAAKNEDFFWGGARAFKEGTKRSFLTTPFNTSTAQLDSYSIISHYRKEFEQLKREYTWLKDLDWMCYLGFKFQIPSKYLYRMDRLGMANSIEIRSPFLDYHLINAAFSTPAALKIKNNEPKYILKKSLERLLPDDILYRKKMGFCVPLQEWAGDIMLDYMDEHLKSFTRNTGIFNEAGLQNQIEQIRKGNKAYTNQLWTIYFMMAWFKKMDVGLMKTVVLITNIPTPYRIPLFNLLSEEMRIAGLELHVIFSSLGYKRRKFEINPNDFKFSYTLLDGGKYSVGEDAEKTYFFYRGLWKQLRTIKPWRIISSGFSPATIICAFHKFIYGTPFLIWSGTIELGARKTKWWRKLFRKVLLKKATSFITYGTKASEYLEGLGAKKESVYMAMNTVDTTFFREETNAARSRIKKQDNFTFAYLGYLVPRKNVHKIIEAAAVLSKTRKDFRIIIIGDGVSKADLEREVMDQQLKGLIQFRGYLQKQELPAVFAETDALLFQTDFDIWGLVLNEAMAAGIACMASNKAGAVYDLIEEGKTGYINDFSNISQTVNKMEWMIDHKEAMERTGKSASVFIAEKASLAIAVAGFMSAIKNS